MKHSKSTDALLTVTNNSIFKSKYLHNAVITLWAAITYVFLISTKKLYKTSLVVKIFAIISSGGSLVVAKVLSLAAF